MAFSVLLDIRARVNDLDEYSSAELGSRPDMPIFRKPAPAPPTVDEIRTALGVDTLTARVAALEARVALLPPVIGSGMLLPTADRPGWVHAWGNDFTVNCDEGAFATVYSGTYTPATTRRNGQIRAYPATYKDTRTQGHPERNSYYDPGALSVVDSVLRKRLHTDAAGRIHVAALVPILSASSNVLGGRFEVCWRVDVPLPGFKAAWLLWPQSNHSTTGDGVGADGEIDWPEFNFDGDNLSGFVHWQGGTSPARPQTSISSPMVGVGTGWHRTALEWRPGTLTADGKDSTGGSVKFFLDGVQVGKTVTEHVPATPMHWVVQTESILSAGDVAAYGVRGVDPGVEGFVEIDWMSYWSMS